MRYPFMPEVLDALPEPLAELYRELEDTLLNNICKRLKVSGELNEVTVQDIRALRAHGIDLKDIKRAISDVTKTGEKELNKLFDDVVARNQEYYTDLIDLAHITQPETLVAAADIEAIRAQTLGEFANITQSMGFLLTKGGEKVLLPPAQAYQWALDKAATEVQSGAISYREAVRNAVKALAESGIKTVDYESGHVDHIDVAVRRAVVTGISQVNAKFTEQSAEYLGTEHYEVSAHGGARDVGVGPMNHKAWQGKVYSKRAGDKYPSIYEVCGLDTGEGLEGWNCRHRHWPFVDGVSERTYTDEQLENIDPPPFEYEGKKYSMYEATQKQRQIERTIRALKRKQTAYQAAGEHADASNAKGRIQVLTRKYREFSKVAKLPEQRDRMKVEYR